jgi:hypothetical protein
MVVRFRVQLREILKHRLILGLSADHLFDNLDCLGNSRLQRQALSQKHDRAEELRGAAQHDPQPILGALEVPRTNVCFRRHSERQEVLGFIAQEPVNDRFRFEVLAFAGGNGGGIELRKSKSRLDRGQFRLFGISFQPQSPTRRGRDPEHTRIGRRTKQCLGEIEGRARVPPEQLARGC